MLQRVPIPGLLVTGTDTGVGKTLVAGAIAAWFVRRGHRVAVCKPIATGCVHRREGLVSEDAEFLAHHGDARFALNVICPQRFAEPLAPAVAAERAGQTVDWTAIDRSIQMMSRQSDVMIVEGIGGLLVPLDASHSVLDMIGWLGLPAVIVARPGLGTINHTLLTVSALRQAKAPIAGVVVNQYPSETPGIAEETNPRAIERWGKVPVLCLSPRFSQFTPPFLPTDFVAAFENVDWLGRANVGQGDRETGRQGD